MRKSGASYATLLRGSLVASAPYRSAMAESRRHYVPPPLMSWDGEVYVFSGRFAYGTRHQCQMDTMERGADVDENLTQRTTFLVLGTFGSRDWKQSSFGRKIERAVELRDSGFPLRIVGEDHWARALSAAV
jgi:hypothetical protein